jgi:hypothetical protein
MYALKNFDGNSKTLYIEIGSENLDNKEFRYKLPSILSHELMHGNVNLNLFGNGQFSLINRYSDLYIQCVNVIKKGQYDLAYYFAYALYSTDWQEVQAFVSQTSGEIIDTVRRLNHPITRSEFKKIYANTNSVLTYHSNVEICNTILSMDCKDSYNEICFDIPFFKNLLMIKKYAKHALNISGRALKDCGRNSMIAQEYLCKNNLLKF